MSNSQIPLHVIKVFTPVLDFTGQREYAALEGGSMISWKPFTTTSISNSSVQFTSPPPNPQIVIDRKMYMQLPVRLVFNCDTPNANNILRQGFDAPRAFPLNTCLNTVTMNINNVSITQNSADIIQALLRYNTSETVKERDYSGTPSMLDQSQEYSELIGSVRNPLGSYEESNEGSVMGRGGFQFKIVLNTPTKAVVDLVVWEPLLISPLYFGRGNAQGFSCNTLDWNFTFIGNVANRMWSHCDSNISNDAPGPITSSLFGFNNFANLYNAPFSYTNNIPILLFKYITPSLLTHIPNRQILPYFRIERYPSDFSEVAPDTTAVLASNNIQLQVIPRRMYIYIRETNAELYSSPTKTDTYFSIESLSLNFNNFSGLLSSATKWDLYNISMKNHCNMSWSQWSGNKMYKNGSFNETINGPGSVLCLQFGDDIPLSDGLAPGVSGTFQLQFTINCKNVNQTRAIKPTLYIVAVQEGTLAIMDGSAVIQLGVLNRDDVLNAQVGHLNYGDLQDIYGGGDFFSSAKNFGHKILTKMVDAYKKYKPYIKKGVKIASQILPYLAAGEEDGGLLYEPSTYISENDMGGKMMKRSSLKHRLQRR